MSRCNIFGTTKTTERAPRLFRMAIFIGFGENGKKLWLRPFAAHTPRTCAVCVVVLKLPLDVPTLTDDYSPLKYTCRTPHTFEARHLRDDETLSAEREIFYSLPAAGCLSAMLWAPPRELGWVTLKSNSWTLFTTQKYTRHVYVHCVQRANVVFCGANRRRLWP